MDLSQATSSDVLQYRAGWRAAQQGLPYQVGSYDPYWLTGWADQVRSVILTLRRCMAEVANDR